MTLLDVNRNDFQNFINFMYLRERNLSPKGLLPKCLLKQDRGRPKAGTGNSVQSLTWRART